MKLFILIVGLSALVPVDGDDAIVLLPDARSGKTWEMFQESITAPAHSSTIAFQAVDGWLSINLEGDRSFWMPGDQQRSLATMIDVSRFSEGLGAATVPQACVDWGGGPELCGAVARLRLTGGKLTAGNVRINPEVADPENMPGGLVFETKNVLPFFGSREYSKLEVPEDSTEYVNQGTSALLFEITVPEGFSVDDKQLSKIECGFVGSPEDCFFIQIRNIPDDYFRDAPMEVCAEVDTHFGRFYDLLPSTPEDYLRLPLALDWGKTEGVRAMREKPSCRCPHALLSAP